MSVVYTDDEDEVYFDAEDYIGDVSTEILIGELSDRVLYNDNVLSILDRQKVIKWILNLKSYDNIDTVINEIKELYTY